MESPIPSAPLSQNSDSQQQESNTADLRSSESFWSQPCGIRDVLSVGIPMVVSTLSYSIMQFCDRLFLAWHSELEMAAIMPAVILTWTASALPMGISSYANTFVAQYCGSGQQRMVGAIIWNACCFGILFLPVFLLLAFFAGSLFSAFGHSPALVPLETSYFQIACLGSPAVVIEAAIAAFFIGRGKTMIVMYVSLGATAINLLLDWWLIFGIGSIPEMGIQGAAWATTVSVWLKVICYLLLMLRRENREPFGLQTGFKLDRRLLGRLFRFGFPSGCQLWLEGLAISLFVLFIGQIGEMEAAATTIAFSLNLLAFIPVVGMGMSVSILVGERIGSNEVHLAKRAVRNGLIISLLYSLFFVVLYLFTPHFFLLAHAAGTQGAHYDGIQSTTVFLLRFVAFYCLFDCVQIIYSSALRGAGDTRFILVATLFNSVFFVTIGISGSYLIDVSFALTWWFSMITGWILGFAMIFWWRYRAEVWTGMSVIQPDEPTR
jgi:MATE family multidrug resistance protein